MTCDYFPLIMMMCVMVMIITLNSDGKPEPVTLDETQITIVVTISICVCGVLIFYIWHSFRTLPIILMGISSGMMADITTAKQSV